MGRKAELQAIHVQSGIMVHNYGRGSNTEYPWEVVYQVSSFGGVLQEKRKKNFSTKKQALDFANSIKKAAHKSTR